MADNKLPLFEGAGKFYVYVYRDPRPKKKLCPIYVGKGTAAQGRADVHWKKGARNPLLKAVLNKIRAACLEPAIEIVAWFDDEGEAFQYEQRLIEKFGIRSEGGTLCNLLVGEDGGGWTHSEETKKKISLKIKGQKRGPPSAETRAKISERLTGRILGPNPAHSAKLKGRKLTPEHCAAISAGNTGRIVDQETRDKIGASNKDKVRSDETRLLLSLSHIGNTPSSETKIRMSKSQKERWDSASDEARKAHSDAVRAALNTPEWRDAQRDRVKERSKDPVYIEKLRQSAKDAWVRRKAKEMSP